MDIVKQIQENSFNSVVKRFRSLLKDDTYKDLAIIPNNSKKPIVVHSFMLKYRCPKFLEELLTQQVAMSELSIIKKDQVVCRTKYSSGVINTVIYFIYNDNVQYEHTENTESTTVENKEQTNIPIAPIPTPSRLIPYTIFYGEKSHAEKDLIIEFCCHYNLPQLHILFEHEAATYYSRKGVDFSMVSLSAQICNAAFFTSYIGSKEVTKKDYEIVEGVNLLVKLLHNSGSESHFIVPKALLTGNTFFETCIMNDINRGYSWKENETNEIKIISEYIYVHFTEDNTIDIEKNAFSLLLLCVFMDDIIPSIDYLKRFIYANTSEVLISLISLAHFTMQESLVNATEKVLVSKLEYDTSLFSSNLPFMKGFSSFYGLKSLESAVDKVSSTILPPVLEGSLKHNFHRSCISLNCS